MQKQLRNEFINKLNEMEDDIRFFKKHRHASCNMDLTDLEQAIVDIYKYISTLPVEKDDESKYEPK